MDTVIHIGQPAPYFSLPDLDGRLHRQEETRGRILVISFWSAECPWVARADQEIMRLLPGWGECVLYWAIASNDNEPAELLREAAQERRVPVVLIDTRHKVADLYGAQITPHFFVLDRDGVFQYQGALDDVTFRQRQPQRFFLDQAVQSLLAGRPPETTETASYGCALVRMT